MASLSQQTRQQPAEPAPSQTETITTLPSTASQTQVQRSAILRLRGAHAPTRRSVQWRSDVVDNEGLNKKKSKVCCIYHRPRAIDESSDESSSSSSSSDSDSDSDSDSGASKRPGGGDGPGEDQHGHEHQCDGHQHHHHSHRRGRGETGKRRRRRPSPNAYEKMPRYNKPGGDGSGGGVEDPGKGQGGPQGPQAGV
ncbi:hypothetical protein VTK56DRAFT_9622 [Thermocarpiscus australiensis]